MNSIILIVKKVSGNSKVLTNQVYISPKSFHENVPPFNYVKLNGKVVYKCSEPFDQGFIGVSAPVRTAHGLILGEDVDVEPFYDLTREQVLNLRISIRMIPSKDKPSVVYLAVKELAKVIRTTFSEHFFFPNQCLSFEYKGRKFTIDVHDDVVPGFLGPSTGIRFYPAKSVELMSFEETGIRRDLFRENFDFEQLGIGGANQELINIFRRALATRGVNYQVAEDLGVNHVKGILLHGVPGTGKTLIARNISKLLTTVPPKIVNGPEIMNKFVGQSEENIRNLFADAQADQVKLKSKSPLHVLVFDEIDAICRTRGSGTNSGVRDGVVNQLLTMIQGTDELKNIMIIAMTNRKDLLDPALLRPGRIGVHIEIGLPDIQGREQIFRIHTRQMHASQMMSPDVSLKTLAQMTENYTGAEIEQVVSSASSYALSEVLDSDKDDIESSDVMVTMDHFLRALQEVVPAMGKSTTILSKDLPEEVTPLKDVDCLRTLFETKIQRISKALVVGDRGQGKTTYLKVLGSTSTFHQCVRWLEPLTFFNMSPSEKLKKLGDVFREAYMSKRSLILIDDLDILCEFVVFGSTISHFSNQVLQGLATLLKTLPTQGNHTIDIVCTCSNPVVADFFHDKFDLQISLN